MESFHPGDEYELVDEYARQLKFQSWYEWRPDAVPPPSNLGERHEEHQVPLTTDQPEAYAYCLDALRRFDGKNREGVFAVVSEIGMLGVGGIDHEAPGKTYELKACPGESFSGLHLLCLMYVGFKIIEPSLNTGIDFSIAYAMALEARGGTLH